MQSQSRKQISRIFGRPKSEEIARWLLQESREVLGRLRRMAGFESQTFDPTVSRLSFLHAFTLPCFILSLFDAVASICELHDGACHKPLPRLAGTWCNFEPSWKSWCCCLHQLCMKGICLMPLLDRHGCGQAARACACFSEFCNIGLTSAAHKRKFCHHPLSFSSHAHIHLCKTQGT